MIFEHISDFFIYMQRPDFHIDYITRRCIFIECPNTKFVFRFYIYTRNIKYYRLHNGIA